MNCSLLEDDDYINDITAKIPVWLAEGYKELSDNRNIWDWIKYNIRINAIQHSKRKAKERNDKEKTLQNVYAKAKQNVDLDPNNANVNALNSAKENLELFYEEKVHGIVIRARARWHEHGERSSKYFLNLEKRNHVKKHMRRLKISGSTKTDFFNILSEQKRFYQDLYTSKNIRTDSTQTAESFLSNLDIPRLTEEQKLSCEGKITPGECAAVLENFQNNKSPGNDGIPVEFYKKILVTY